MANESFKCCAFTCVMTPFEKSNTSSLSSLRISMLFWQRDSLDLDDPTRSGINVGHLAGHSCFRI